MIAVHFGHLAFLPALSGVNFIAWPQAQLTRMTSIDPPALTRGKHLPRCNTTARGTEPIVSVRPAAATHAPNACTHRPKFFRFGLRRCDAAFVFSYVILTC